MNEEQITLDLPNYEFRYVQTGMGKVKAAIHLLDAIYTERPDIVLNIGTAGTLRHRAGEIFVCRGFIDRDFQKNQLLGL
ncbi:MAG: nucleosidase, partial [Bacteroidaceae bacterium]